MLFVVILFAGLGWVVSQCLLVDLAVFFVSRFANCCGVFFCGLLRYVLSAWGTAFWSCVLRCLGFVFGGQFGGLVDCDFWSWMWLFGVY